MAREFASIYELTPNEIEKINRRNRDNDVWGEDFKRLQEANPGKLVMISTRMQPGGRDGGYGGGYTAEFTVFDPKKTGSQSGEKKRGGVPGCE